MEAINQSPQYNTKFGSKKIPRYIYHMTTGANYEAILNDGFIKMSESQLYVDKGIYAFDLMNFLKCWSKKNKDWEYDDLQSIILRHIVKWIKSLTPKKDELVILRIPTSKLDTDKLFVRSLNRVFKFESSEQKLRNAPYSIKEHLSGNTPAYESPLYKMRKEAIEFIYKDNIPITNIERIGNIINIPSLRKDAGFRTNPISYIMKASLSGAKESSHLKI